MPVHLVVHVRQTAMKCLIFSTFIRRGHRKLFSEMHCGDVNQALREQILHSLLMSAMCNEL